jgi:hypothetical protein
MKVVLFIIYIILVSLIVSDARGIWGSKRKRKDEDDEPANAQRAPTSQPKSTGRKRSMGMDGMPDMPGMPDMFGGSPLATLLAAKSDDILQMLFAAADYIEEAVETPEFDDFLTPEGIRDMFSNIPNNGMEDQIESILESESFQDPELLKQTVREGVQSFRLYAEQMAPLLSNPMMVDQLLKEVPPELLRPIELYVNNDLIGMREFLDEFPDIPEIQKEILLKVFEGDKEGLKSLAKDLLSNPEQLESTRLQLLENPELAESLGIDISIVKNKKQWNAFIRTKRDEMDSDEDSFDFDIAGNDPLATLHKLGLHKANDQRF